MRKDFTTSVVRPFFACLLKAIGIGRVEVASRAYLGHLPGRIVQGVGSGFDRCAEGSSFTGFATLSVILEACFDPSTINDLSQATIFAPDRVVDDVCCVRCQNPCCVPDSGKVCKSLFRNRAGDRSNERSVAETKPGDSPRVFSKPLVRIMESTSDAVALFIGARDADHDLTH